MSRILPLPADAVAQIHSSKHITSLQGVVLSLLENSLDGGANKIEVCIDFSRGACTVEDNGTGIPVCEFHEDGGLGKLHHTSKHATSEADELHGQHGAYLSSLSALSFLMVTSKCKDQQDSATIAMHKGLTVSRHIPALPAHELSLSPAHGTRATVRDLFGNMPVRVKQRALSSNDVTGGEKKWQDLKRQIVALLLAWPKSCAVKLLDGETGKNIMSVSGYHPGFSTDLTEKNLRALKGRTSKVSIRDSLAVLFQATLVSTQSRQSWVPLHASTEKVSLEGVICLEPAAMKHNQFISIGIHPCFVGGGHNEFYDAVNKVFATSSFSSDDGDWNMDELEVDGSTRPKDANSNYTQRQLKGRKGVDKWPMFVFRIKFKDGAKDRTNAENPTDGNIKAIVNILEASVFQWLTAHHFRPQKRKRRLDDNQQSPSASSTPPRSRTGTPVSPSRQPKFRKLVDRSRRRDVGAKIPGSTFDEWSRIKTGDGRARHRLADSLKDPTPSTKIPGDSANSLNRVGNSVFGLPSLDIGDLGSRHVEKHVSGALDPLDSTATKDLDTVSSEHFGSHDDAATLDLESDLVRDTLQENEDEIMECRDPVTKELLKINARTGAVLPSRPKEQRTESSTRSAAVSSAGRPLSMSRRNRPQTEPKWLPGFLKDWNNPVFANQSEEPIRAVSFCEINMDSIDSGNKRCNHQHLQRNFGNTGAASFKKLSKAALKQVEVIRQVDGKFILCKMPCAPDEGGVEMLVLVDQHAVSERVILERLLEEMCVPARSSDVVTNTRHSSSIQTSLLERPLRFQISLGEKDMFFTHAQSFAQWGILYDLKEIPSCTTASQVRGASQEYQIIVRCLPPGIAERCSLFPNLLIELLRSEVWIAADAPQKLSQTSPDDFSTPAAAQKHSWLARIGNCPQGILNMLNSRACRSAIMFNDQLSVAQCGELMNGVSECAFPFICAHGRVSMVPILEIGEGGSGLGELFGKDRTQGGNHDNNNNENNVYKRWMKGHE